MICKPSENTTLATFAVILLVVVALAWVLVYIHTTPTAEQPQECGDIAMFKAMEQYGQVYVGYLSPAWHNNDIGSWNGRFESVNTTLQVKIEAKGKTMCEAVNNLYDKWSEIPFQYTEHEQ